jgi:hypothetical protein
VVDEFELVLIGFQVEAAQRQNLGDNSHTRPPVHLNEHIQGVGDACLNGSIRNFDAALQYARSEARNTLGRGVSVDGRNGAAVPCIEELEQVESFATSNLD